MDPTELLAFVPPEVIRRHRVVPRAASSRVLEIGVAAEPAAGLLRDLAFATGRAVVPVFIDAQEIDRFIAAHVPPAPEEADESVVPDEPVTSGGPGTGDRAGDPSGDPSGDRAGDPSARPPAGESPASEHIPVGSVVQQIDALLYRAVAQGASDIHIEPYEHTLRVRYRLDGVLRVAEEMSLLQRDAVVARLKILASLDIAERRRPQDGRLRFRQGARTIDVRVSTLPTSFGEKVVLRLLDRSRLRLDLEALGLEGRGLDAFRRAIRLPYGLILVTGPTGSGKTTTLYAALSALNTPDVNVVTIEDPIEYDLPGINQAHVRGDIGFTFAQALRAFLRQDPNVIMVGEIRDAETAEVAVRAALTGHLVLSTLHTNDAPSAVVRLVDMGVEPFLVSAALRLVAAQRLVRRLCPHCRDETPPVSTPQGDPGGDAHAAPSYHSRGCVRCGGTGYSGRTALFEVMPVDASIAALVSRRAGLEDLRRQARVGGMQTLREQGMVRVRAGLTSIDEVLRETDA